MLIELPIKGYTIKKKMEKEGNSFLVYLPLDN